MAGFIERKKGRGSVLNLGRVLKQLAQVNLNYDDLLVKNSLSVGPSQHRQDTTYGQSAMTEQELLYSLHRNDMVNSQYVPFFDRSYNVRREENRRFARNPEINRILDIMCNELVVYDNTGYCAHSFLEGDNFKEDIRKSVTKNYNHIYSTYGFNDGRGMWNLAREFLIDGVIAIEIIWDDPMRPKIIKGFKRMETTNLRPTVIQTDAGPVDAWIQEDARSGQQIQLLDSQVIYISYGNGNLYSRYSYVENLIRSFNLLRAMEDTRVAWNVMNSTYRLKIVMPAGTKITPQSKQALSALLAYFKEDITYDNESGEVKIEGKAGPQFYRNYVFPKKEGETVEIDSLRFEGHDLSDMGPIKFFHDKLKLDSGIPFHRFDNDSPSTFILDASSQLHAEIGFAAYINRIRSLLRPILMKPLYLMSLVEFPDLKGDSYFKSALGIRWEGNNYFQELKEYEILDRRFERFNKMKEITTRDEDGEEVQLIPTEMLLEKFNILTPDEIESINKARKKNAKEKPTETKTEGKESEETTPAEEESAETTEEGA